MTRHAKRLAGLIGIAALTSALVVGGTFLGFDVSRSHREPTKLCSARLNDQILRFPCAWGRRFFDPRDMPSEAWLELRPFAIDGQSIKYSTAEITIYLTAEKGFYRGNIFGKFGLTKDDFDRIAVTPFTADLPSQFGYPSSDLYRLTFEAEGGDWVVSTFHDSSFRPLLDGNGYGAIEAKWYVHFESGDADVPSFGMVCSFAPNCQMQLQEDKVAARVFVSRRLVGERHRIAASVRAITRAIVESSLSPSEHRNPCVVVGVCLPDLVIAPLSQ